MVNRERRTRTDILWATNFSFLFRVPLSTTRLLNSEKLMFRAFADPIRLRILNLIQDGELCVCDLVEVLKLPQPTVSRHLSYLRRAGLVRVRQERSWNFCELAAARSAFHSKLLECLATCYTDVPEMTQDRTRSPSSAAAAAAAPRNFFGSMTSA